MGTLNEDLTGIKAIEDKLTANKVANFAYTDHAYENPLTEADGVEYYNVDNEQNIPVPDPSVMDVNETVLTKGLRSQASSIPRMLMNHFLGRTSYNLNKLNDNMSSLLATLMSHLGSANGIAPLNANGVLDIAKGGTNASTVGDARTNLNINNVVNTGDSATPTENGTTKFTTGGAYTELNKKVDKSSVTSEVASGNNNPVTSGGVYEALKDKVNMLIQSNPGGVITYVMIKCENYASLNMLITNRYSDMLIIQSQAGQMMAKKLSSNINYSLDSIKVFSFSENNTTKGAVLLKFKGYNPLAIIQLDAQSVYSKSYISQAIFEDPYSNFNNISYYKGYNTMSTVPFVGTPVPPSSNGNYALQCKVSSGALSYNWNDSDVTIPSDAVLHYSFDDVPDLPDGTADYLRKEDFADADGWAGGSNTVTATDGVLTVANTVTNYLFKNFSLSNKVIKAVIRSSVTKEVSLYGTVSGATVTLGIANCEAGQKTVICGYIDSAFTSIGFMGLPLSAKFEVLSIYIGDGSYSTPIIDNSGDNINAVNNGGIAVQGVCGKGVYFPNGKYANISNINLSNDFTISLWVKPSDNTQGETGTIIGKRNVIRILNGATWAGGTNAIHVSIYTEGNENYGYFSSLLPANTWTHLVVLKSGNTAKVYLNGILSYTKTLSSITIDVNNEPLELNMYPNFSATRPQTYDDLLIFNRALSADEVTALYLNKANTPKFYNINNYLLDNRSAVPAENGTDLFTTGGAYSLLQSINGKAPTNHASTTTDYGVADSSNYGHVKKGVNIGLNFERVQGVPISHTGSDDVTIPITKYGLVYFFIARSNNTANITLKNTTGNNNGIAVLDLQDMSVHILYNNDTYLLGRVQETSSGEVKKYAIILPSTNDTLASTSE